MSISLPSRQLSRSASMHLQSTHPVASSTKLSLSLSPSLVAISPSPICRGSRHFQTSTPSQKGPSLRPGGYTPQKNEASMKSSPPVMKAPRTENLRLDVQKRAEAAATRARARVAEQQQKAPQLGSLADNSLFADQQQRQRSPGPGKPTVLSREEPQGFDPAALELRNPSHLAAAINPRPETRARWQRRMVIRSIRQRGRLTKTVKIARSERSSLSKSHFFKTSMKKLAPLARQIAGKPIDEAILQMRFSKKKVAQEVREHLLEAKHQAIVARGMGLAHLQTDTQPQQSQQHTSTSLQLSPTTTINQNSSQPPTQPKTLPGTTIPSNPAHRSPTDMYIAQAWINRGPYGQSPDYRAFGRLFIMRPPHTAISVLLKEEKTRAREAADKEIKKIRQRMGKNMWTQLPDRKVTRQGQYLLW